MIQTLMSIVFGGIIGFIASWYFYVRSAGDLRREAAELRRLVRLLLLSMEHAGWVRLNFDAAGNILGFEQIVSSKSISSTLEIIPPTVRIDPPSETQERR